MSQKVAGSVAVVYAWDTLVRWLATAWSTARLKALLRWLGCSYGPGLQSDGHTWVRVREPGAIQFGRQIRINSRCGANLAGLSQPTIFQCFRGGRIQLGDAVGLSGAILSSRASIVVGDRVNIGVNARIYDHDFHAVEAAARRDGQLDRQQVRSAPVVIGNDVLIGANAIILKGVRVGDRSVIGAGAVVTLREIPADSLVAGNPARVVRSLIPCRQSRNAASCS